MNISVVVEHRFHRTPDGAVWTDGPFGYSFWKQYLRVFDGVRAAARVRGAERVQHGWARADGAGVSFAPIPYYVGPWQYLRRSLEVRRAVGQALGPGDAVLLRIPSQLGRCAETALHAIGKPFAVDVVGDPHDAFSPGANRHPLRAYFRRRFRRDVERQCRRCDAAAYVTARALQRRYPAAPGVFQLACSDVELPAESFRDGPRAQDSFSTPPTLITVGSLDHLYKAQDVLIEAVAVAVRSGADQRLLIVGDGRLRGELARRAASLGVARNVEFRGKLPAGESVRAALDGGDLFVLPSRQEGLPRAMIEAMARGLPCLGSAAGGIPELLAVEDLVPANDPGALAAKIAQVVSNPARMASMSARNLDKAHEFREELLLDKRAGFYRHLQQQTQLWLDGRPSRRA